MTAVDQSCTATNKGSIFTLWLSGASKTPLNLDTTSPYNPKSPFTSQSSFGQSIYKCQIQCVSHLNQPGFQSSQPLNMNPNLVLIIGLSSGLAFLNIVLFSLWYLWEHRRRKGKDLERDTLTSLNHRPRKLVKRNRPSPPAPTHTLPEKYGTHSYSDPVRNRETIYHPSPYDLSLPPEHKSLRPLGLSPLRNELYPAPAPSFRRTASTDSGETGSIYSTMSAPVHLHDELLSETHSSFLTVDILDTLNMVEKYDPGAYHQNHPLATDNTTYFIQDLKSEASEQTYPTIYHYHPHGTPPNYDMPLQQWPEVPPDWKKEMCSVLPFHPTKPDAPDQISSVLEEDFPSRLRSPYSP